MNLPAQWEPATDGAGSGIFGYSYVVDKIANTEVDQIFDFSTLPTSITIGSRGNGDYYVHVRAVDNNFNKTAGQNWSEVAHFGPFTFSR